MDKKLKLISIGIWSLIAVFLTGVLIYNISAGKNGLSIFSITQFQETNLKAVRQESTSISGINNISLDFSGENVTIFSTDETDLKVIERCNRNLSESQKFNMVIDGQDLKISEGKSTVSLFGILACNRSLELYIPKQYVNNLTMNLNSGNVKIENDIRLKNIIVSEKSGNFEVKGILKSDSMDVNNMSGTVRTAELISKSYNFVLNSGNLTIDSLSGSGSVKCTSGNINIRYKELGDNTDVSAVSGNITLYVPKDTSFKFQGNSSSGNISSDFNLTFQGGGRSLAQSVNGGGAYKNINVRVISGNINFYKAP